MLTIRPAQLEDCDSLVLLCHELGYDTSIETLVQQLAQFQTHPDHAVFVAEVASSEGQEQGAITPLGELLRIGGWIHVHLHRTLQEGCEAEIGGLVVSEKLRGQGIGQQLVRQAEAWAQEQGCPAVVVRSNVQRRGAHQFYQRMSYQEIKRSIVFRHLINPLN